MGVRVPRLDQSLKRLTDRLPVRFFQTAAAGEPGSVQSPKIHLRIPKTSSAATKDPKATSSAHPKRAFLLFLEWVLRCSEAFRSVPKRSEALRSVPKNSEAFRQTYISTFRPWASGEMKPLRGPTALTTDGSEGGGINSTHLLNGK